MNAAPAVANANADAVLPPVAAQAAASHRRVGRSVKRLRTAEQLETTDHITEHELGQQFGCAVESALGMIPGPAQGQGAPAWAQPLLAMPAQLIALNAQLIALRALQQNGLAEGPNDVLVGVPNVAGQPVPAVFPATRGQLETLPGAAVNQLLAYYGLAPVPGNVSARRRQLRGPLGVRSIHFD